MKFGSICQEPLIRESKEKPARTHKKPTLYDVVSIGEPIIPKHVAVVPEFLNDSAGVVRHGRRFVFFAKSDCILLRLESLDQAPRRISRVRVKAIDRACLC